MKKSLLRLLSCSGCGGTFSLESFESDGSEVRDGVLLCGGCGRWYPVISGIPRMLPAGMINSELLDGFMNKYGSRLPERAVRDDRVDDLKRRTARSFGFQWNKFSDIYREYEQGFLDYIHPLKPSFFRGKTVLDAGCGFGRFTNFASKYGAEVVGFDLSDAVEAAYSNCGRMKNVHIVQGDIYNPPFGKKFDFIMSIGVLHHLPDPKKGFLSLVGLMGKGTRILAWLYGSEGRAFKTMFLEGTIRKVTVKMPQRMLYYFCYLPAALYHMFNGIHNVLNRWKTTSGLAERLPFKNYAVYPFRVKLADSYDFLGTPVNNYYTREECEEWARDAGLKEVSVTSLKGRSWRIIGRK